MSVRTNVFSKKDLKTGSEAARLMLEDKLFQSLRATTEKPDLIQASK